MKNKDCIFCKLASEKPWNALYEDESVIALLNIKPIMPGHTIILPKEHSENFEDINEENAAKCLSAIKKLAPIISKAVNADGFNIGLNNNPAAGQVIMHTHFHIIPRFNNDGLSEWPNKDASKESLQELKDKIIKFINT